MFLPVARAILQMEEERAKGTKMVRLSCTILELQSDEFAAWTASLWRAGLVRCICNPSLEEAEAWNNILQGSLDYRARPHLRLVKRTFLCEGSPGCFCKMQG